MEMNGDYCLRDDASIRVMFVDDEDKARNLLRISVNWAELGYEVTADASSAAQALELIPQENPDLIITDIEMPFINGLDFAQMVQQEYPHIRIFILTGHDVFEYAKRGVELGIVRFLLKPLQRKELAEALGSVRETFREERQKIYEYEKLKKQLDENWDSIVQSFLNNMVTSRAYYDVELLQEQLSYYQLPLQVDTGHYNVLLLTPERKQKDLEAGVLEQIQCKELVVSTSSMVPGLVVFSDMYQNIVVLSQNKDVNLLSYSSYFTTLIAKRLGISAYSGVGTPVEALGDISNSYKQAYNNMKLAQISRGDAYVRPQAESGVSGLSVRLKDDIDELCIYIKASLEEETNQKLDDIFALIRKERSESFANKLIHFLSIISGVLSTVNEMGIPYYAAYERESLPYIDILAMKDIEEVENYVSKVVRAFTIYIGHYNSSAQSDLIRNVIRYVEEHLGDSELSLKVLSETYYVNPSYLSRVFKENTGTTFGDYIATMRIEKAKKLLRSTDLRVYDIAEQIGIDDPNYFSKYFKKHTGYTPAAYKETNV